MDESDLRDFIVHFKDGKTVNVRAATFEPKYRNSKCTDFSFFVEIALEKGKGTKGCIYVNPDEVAAIIPIYAEGYDGQNFKSDSEGRRSN